MTSTQPETLNYPIIIFSMIQSNIVAFLKERFFSSLKIEIVTFIIILTRVLLGLFLGLFNQSESPSSL